MGVDIRAQLVLGCRLKDISDKCKSQNIEIKQNISEEDEIFENTDLDLHIDWDDHDFDSAIIGEMIENMDIDHTFEVQQIDHFDQNERTLIIKEQIKEVFGVSMIPQLFLVGRIY